MVGLPAFGGARGETGRENADVNLWVASLVIASVVAVSVAAMIVVRLFAPRGGFFTDSDRAAGVLGVIGTSFAVLLAFVIFLAFESYGTARAKSGQEAVAVAELFHTAQLFRASERQELQGGLVCYARAVIEDEWRTMRDREPSELVQRWVTRIEEGGSRVSITGPKQTEAYAHWFDAWGDRLDGRRGRLAEAEPFVPALLWLVLLLGAFLLLVYMCFFADPAEPIVVQGLMMGAIAAIAASGLLTVRFLDRPYENQSGSLKPTLMSRSLRIIESDWTRIHPGARIPCDERGTPA
jgi:hypothetical protein